ncbi:MAG: AtpZ/AtpI family protein [Actinobacteria bacterium]|nr:AtpZ/AtpI family protein [Actinomycetota bacterium]
MAQRSLGVWELVTLGATTLGCLVGGLVIGLVLDKHLDTLPLYTLVGLALGLVCGCGVTYVRVRQFLHG